MVARLVQPGRTLAKRLLLIQSSLVIFVAAGIALTISVDWGVSAFIGGGIFVLANAIFAFFAFMYSGARAAKAIMASFFIGEALKILITVILFSVVYMYMKVDPVPLKLTYLLVLSINIFLPALYINKK